MLSDFRDVFSSLYIPVIICENTGDWPVSYMNSRAELLLSPTASVDQLKGEAVSRGSLSDVLDFSSQAHYTTFRQTGQRLGHVDDFRCEIKSSDGTHIPVSLSGVLVSGRDDKEFFVIYLMNIETIEGAHYEHSLTSILNAAFLTDNVDASIDTILALTGQLTGVSRTYIFEETSSTMTANTYEWCAPGVEPAIDGLQNLAKADYNYDVIIESGMFITDDVSDLPDSDREILEMQGIKSLAIITFYEGSRPLGYVGFDDTEKTRQWKQDEIQFLKSISALLSVLIIRRNVERNAKNTLDVLQFISDNASEIIYANDINDYRLLFVNKALSDSLGKSPEELIGQPCYKVLQRGMDEPCPFCPIPKIHWNPEEDRSATYNWEQINTITGKTYLAKDNIVNWVDGRPVHVETAIDITQRVAYEKELERVGSYDAMTGIHNREWGGNILAEKLAGTAGGSLCFIDVDGLKAVNDSFGHAVGDEMLKETVRILREYMSDYDYICRWGGDEFLLWTSRSPAEMESFIKTVETAAAKYNETMNKPFCLSFSHGIVPFEGARLDDIVKRADHLMYDHKMEKRGLLKNRRRTDKIDTENKKEGGD